MIVRVSFCLTNRPIIEHFPRNCHRQLVVPRENRCRKSRSSVVGSVNDQRDSFVVSNSNNRIAVLDPLQQFILWPLDIAGSPFVERGFSFCLGKTQTARVCPFLGKVFFFVPYRRIGCDIGPRRPISTGVAARSQSNSGPVQGFHAQWRAVRSRGLHGV
jgi:hypothetical protein